MVNKLTRYFEFPEITGKGPLLSYRELTEEEKKEIDWLAVGASIKGYKLRQAFGNAIFPNAEDKIRERQEQDIERPEVSILKQGWK